MNLAHDAWVAVTQGIITLGGIAVAALGGRVYSEFSRAVHVVETGIDWDPLLPTELAFDYGLDTTAVIVCQDHPSEYRVLGLLEMGDQHGTTATPDEVTPALRNLIRSDRTRQNSDTIHHKQFPGGQLTVAWSNSKSRLASRPIRIVLLDEIDKYATDPGPQGDPVMRAINRSKTFWNRKFGMWSTPTLKGLSRIEKERLLGDDRRYFVPCPDCGEFFTLNFRENIRWDDGKPETAHCICTSCGVCIPENKKSWMVERGKWIAQFPGRTVASFHINELYSSLGGSSWAAIAKKFLDTKGDNVALQNFINETLGETWELTGDTVSTKTLLDRREVYKAQVPAFICALAAGVDVQRDRLEASVWGWGPGHESALIDHRIIVGNVAEDAVWLELDELLNTSYQHELGVELPIIQTFIDSSDGVVTQKVYSYCKQRIANHVFACKGRANKPGTPLPLVERPKNGYCPACRSAWIRAGHPDRLAFEMSRRNEVAADGA